MEFDETLHQDATLQRMKRADWDLMGGVGDDGGLSGSMEKLGYFAGVDITLIERLAGQLAGLQAELAQLRRDVDELRG